MANIIRRSERPIRANEWDPLRRMRELFAWDPFAEMMPSAGLEPAELQPRFEVKETKDSYVFKADLPGIDEKDVDISLTGNRLVVSGKRDCEERREDERFYAYECSYGSFTRAFTLPDGVDVDHAQADMANGVLTLTIPKRPEAQPRKIALKPGGDKAKIKA